MTRLATRCIASRNLGGLDGLAHCVGINDRKPIESYTGSEWDWIVSVNLNSARHLVWPLRPATEEKNSFGVFETTEDDQQLGERVEQAVGATVGA